MTLRRRLTLTAVSVTALVVAVFAVPLAVIVVGLARDTALSAAEHDAGALAPVLAVSDDPDLVRAAIDAAGRGDEHTIGVRLPDGSAIGPLPGGDLLRLVELTRKSYLVDGDAGAVISVTPVLTGDGLAIIAVSIPRSALRHGVDTALGVLALAAVAALVGAGALGDRLGRGVSGPAATLAAGARSLAAGELDTRLDVSSPPELASISEALNELAARVQHLLTEQRELVADLSHRVRTPLTALRIEADSLADQVERDEIVARIDDVSDTVDHVIRQARRPLGPAGPRSCDLVAVVRERASFWAALAEDQDRAMEVTLPDRVAPVALDAHDMGAALDALIGNVFAHTEETTGFAVRVSEADDRWRLVVADEGPGPAAIPAELTERGVSGGGSTGLGLDIVRRTVAGAGGDLQVGPGVEGGFVAVVLLPAARSTSGHDAQLG